MDLIFVLLIAAGALALGGVCGYLVFRYVLKGKYKEMIDTAEKQAEEMLDGAKKQALETIEQLKHSADDRFSEAVGKVKEIISK
jgi:hypothetical protein